jgi:predicted dehydrogenase
VSKEQELEGRLTRRGFFGLTGGALLASSAGPAPAQVPDFPLPELPGRRLGWAVVGLGRLAVHQILPALADCRRSKLTGLVSGSPAKASHLARLHGVDPRHVYSYERYDDIANDPEIDIVYVVLPNSMHAEYTIRALKAGKHVLCEKPMATTPSECEQMIAAARAADRKLMIAYRLHYEPFNRELARIARDPSEMGQARIVEAEAGFPIGDPAQWRLRRKMAGGGSLMDIGIYALQAARTLAGEEPVEVSAMIHSAPSDARFVEVEENVTFQLRFPGGILASCISSYGTLLNRFRVFKTQGSAELEPALFYSGQRLRIYHGNSVEERELPRIDHFRAEMDHLSECVTSGKQPDTPGEEGLRDQRVMAAIYESARGGGTVKLAAAR